MTLFRTRRLRIAARVALYASALLVGLPWAFSEVMVGAIRQPVSPAPRGFAEVWLDSGGLRLRAWVLGAPSERAGAVVVHGVGDTLESYTGIATRLHRRGHPVVLLDLRGHGGSEGRHTTLGGHEREDVRAAMDHARRAGLGGPGLLLMGYSMGAVAALRAAAGASDVRAVVAEAPYDDYRANVAHHAKLFYGLPAWLPLIPLSIRVAEWRARFDADDVDAVAAAREITAPLLLIVDGADERMPERVVRRVYDAHPGPKRLWIAAGADHVAAQLRDDYWETITAFLDTHGV